MTVAVSRDLELALWAPGCPMHRVCRCPGWAATGLTWDTSVHPSITLDVRGLADAVSRQLRPRHAA